MLPGQASLKLSIEDSNPTLENPEIDTFLDQPKGKKFYFNSKLLTVYNKIPLSLI